MKKNIQRSALLLLFSFLMLKMYGQETKRKFEKKEGVYAKQESAYLGDKLKLTKQQAASVDEIEISLVNKRSEAKKISNNDLRKQKYAEIDSWYHTQLKLVLNKKQYSAYQQIIEDSKVRSQNKNAEIKQRYGPKG